MHLYVYLICIFAYLVCVWFISCLSQFRFLKFYNLFLKAWAETWRTAGDGTPKFEVGDGPCLRSPNILDFGNTFHHN